MANEKYGFLNNKLIFFCLDEVWVVNVLNESQWSEINFEQNKNEQKNSNKIKLN